MFCSVLQAISIPQLFIMRISMSCSHNWQQKHQENNYTNRKCSRLDSCNWTATRLCDKEPVKIKNFVMDYYYHYHFLYCAN